MSGVIVAHGKNENEAQFRCNFHDCSTIIDTSGAISWQSIDICFKEIYRSPQFSWPKNIKDIHLFIELPTNEHHQVIPETFESPAAFRFKLQCLSATDHEKGRIARLIVPQYCGYMVRSDIIPLRLLEIPLVTSVVSFSEPRQFFDGKHASVKNLQQLPNIFAASAAGMLLKHINSISTSTHDSLTSFDLELRNRLSFPWISTKVPRKQTLAIVDGRPGPDIGRTGEVIFTAAEALGIDMVELNVPGHWLDGPRYSHWRKAFIPFELPVELPLQSDVAGFANRIVETLRSYDGQIDGLVTFRYHYKVPVAEAASQMLLPTFPSSAFAIATDKFRLSIFEGHEAHRASSVKEASSIVQQSNLEFSMIIKPCNGYLSEGVCRVEHLAQLQAGINAMNTDRQGKDFVIERYCGGPEVDANLVLCDGELLFFEASDEFPKSADVNGHGKIKSFIEKACVLPSKLPGNELTMWRDSLHQNLLRLGVRDGVYHLEAKVENSSMEYVATKENSLICPNVWFPPKGNHLPG